MAITTDRVDGQNIGLRLTAPDLIVDILSVNLSSGAVTSSYLATGDLQAVRAAALHLFGLVPYAERVAGAAGFLQRLVSVAAADNSVVVPGAVVVGEVATLNVTVAANPANLVIHIPYSADSIVAWASGVGGSGGGGGVLAVPGSAPIVSSGGAAPNISLDNSGVAAGVYGSSTTSAAVTVDAHGLVTNASNVSIAFPVTGVTASAPLSSSGGATPDISLTGTVGVSYGGTGVTTIPANGEVLIGNGAGYTVASLTAGANVTITPGAGSITIAASGGGGGGGLTYWSESENSAGVNATVPVDAFTVANAATDVDAAIVAKGTGATLAQIPDGTATGGDKRGQYATDLQKGRSNSTEIASGNFATIVGGSSNVASGYGAVVAGGGLYPVDPFSAGNTASGTLSFVGGGTANAASSDAAVVTGGYRNTASGTFSVVGGGLYNTASGGSAVVGGGFSSTASADYSTVGGGDTNVASGLQATVGGGRYNTASGQQDTIGGGFNNFIASFPTGATIAGGYGNYIPNGNTSYATIGGGNGNVADGFGATVPGGWGGVTRSVWGRYSFASLSPSTAGAYQTGQHVTRTQTTTGATANLTAHGAALSNPANVNTLPDNSTYAIRCLVVARDNVGTSAAWEVTGCVKRGAGAATATLVGVPTVTSIGADAGAAAWTVALVADATYGSAVVQVTDGSGSPTTVDWVCTMFTTEIAL